MDEQMKPKRVRKSADEARAAKLAKIEAQIANHQTAIKELEAKKAELNRPRPLTAKEQTALWKSKIQAGIITEEEAYQLGYKG